MTQEREDELITRMQAREAQRSVELSELKARASLRAGVAAVVSTGRFVLEATFKVVGPVAGALLRDALVSLLDEEIRKHFGGEGE